MRFALLFSLCLVVSSYAEASFTIELERKGKQIQKVGDADVEFEAIAKLNGVKATDAIVTVKAVKFPSGVEKSQKEGNGSATLVIKLNEPSADTYRISAEATLNGLKVTAPELSLTVYRLTVDITELALNQGATSQSITATLEPKLGGETGKFSDSNNLISSFSPTSLYLAEAEASIFTMTAGAVAGATTVTITMEQEPFATATIEVTVNEEYPIVFLSPNDGLNCGTGNVGVNINKKGNEEQPKAFASVDSWKEKYKDKITLQLVGPTSGNPVINFSPSALAGPQTDLIIKAGENSQPGSTHMQAFYNGKAVSNLLKIVAWKDDGNAWVEGRKFSDNAINMPAPVASNDLGFSEYTLEFTSQRSDGDCTDSDWTFDWVAAPQWGFTFNPSSQSGIGRSLTTGTITPDVSHFVSAEVTSYRTISPLKSRRTFKQLFQFHTGSCTPSQIPVLAGGSNGNDDNIHGTDIAFQIDGGIGLKEMRIESNKGYKKHIAPTIDKVNDTTWHFGSSDLVPDISSTQEFLIGAFSRIPLKGGIVRTGKTVVSQTTGYFSIEITKPEGGKIYPNGAVEVLVKYEFRNQLAPHIIRGQMSDKRLSPIEASMKKSTSEKEFEFAGDAAGQGTFTSDVNKKLPEQDDPANSLYNNFRVDLYDEHIFAASHGKEITRDEALSVSGEQRSFWREKPGKRKEGTFWNWATILENVPGGSFKVGTHSTDPTQTFGESETWHGDDYKLDETSEKFKAQFPASMSAALGNLDRLEKQFDSRVLSLELAMSRFDNFMIGLNSAVKLEKLITDMISVYKDIRGLKAKLKELEDMPEKTPAVLRKIAELKAKIENAYKTVGGYIADYNTLLVAVNALDVDAPTALLREADLFKNFALKLKAELLRIQAEDLRKADELAIFILAIAGSIAANPSESADPDEFLKRKLLEEQLGTFKEDAEALRAKIDDVKNRIATLNALCVRVEDAIALAAASGILKEVSNLVMQWVGRLIKAIPIDNPIIQEILNILNVKKVVIDEIKKFLALNPQQDFETVKALVVELKFSLKTCTSNIRLALEEARDISKTFRKPYRTWITPTLEFPESRLDALIPVPGF